MSDKVCECGKKIKPSRYNIKRDKCNDCFLSTVKDKLNEELGEIEND